MFPEELEAIFRGVRARRTREFNLMAQMAWLGARLTAYAPAKSDKFPKLDRLVSRDGTTPAPRRQTWQEQMAITSAW